MGQDSEQGQKEERGSVTGRVEGWKGVLEGGERGVGGKGGGQLQKGEMVEG